MKNSKIIWCDESGLGRNVFALFLRRFNLTTLPSSFPFHLFVDSLYRLRVNGKIVGFGPARFIPSHPQFDSYDLAPWLKPGENTLLVEGNSRGAPCFQAVISRGGFIAAGKIPLADGAMLDLATPGDWQVSRSEAWAAEAEPFSFAQGPVEILDSTRLPAGYPVFSPEINPADWQSPTLISCPEHWGTLTPRSVAMPTMEGWTPETVLLTGSLKGGTARYGFNAANEQRKVKQPFFTHIFSPVEQEIEMGVFWGPLFLNGSELKHIDFKELGNRQNARATLRKGWNFIYGLPDCLQPCWTWLMELPAIDGLLLKALPSSDCDASFGLGPFLEKIPDAPDPVSLDDLKDYPKNWRLVPSDLKRSSPARALGWDVLDTTWMKDAAYQPGMELLPDGEGAVVVLDMGREYLGHIQVDFETENGVTLDVGYDERTAKSGILGFYEGNPFVNSADRIIVGPGRQQAAFYHERGGRHLQLTFRGRPGRIRIHRLEVVQTTADLPMIGDFKCDDDLFDWTWQVGVTTIRACTGDSWVDCPWRERGMYIGDSLISAPGTRKFTNDWRMEPWAILLWSHAQQPGGQLPDVVPSAHETPLCDYTLLWIEVLRNYWAVTGDLAVVREAWPTVDRIFNSDGWHSDDNGLWEVHENCFVFLDWGATKEEKQGVNTSLNAFRFRALECAAELATALGLDKEAEAYTAQADALRKIFRATFWDPKQNRFTACLIDGRFSDTPAYHANTLALVYDLADDSQKPGLLDYVKEGARRNAHDSIKDADGTAHYANGHLDFYFLYFLLSGLYRVGEAALAETVIRENYQVMRDKKAWTFWETLPRGYNNSASLCHGWSACPVVFFSERVLGVRELVPGDPSQILVAPESPSVHWAEGKVPHPAGVIHISWRVDGSNLLLALEVPAGVKVQIRPAGRLAQLKLVRVSAAELNLAGK